MVILGVFEIRVLDWVVAGFEDELVDASRICDAVASGGGEVVRHSGRKGDGVSDRHNENYVKLDQDS